MNKAKDPLINKKIYQGKIFKLLLCFTITFLIMNSISFYKGIEGQKINSSALMPNSSTTIKNSGLLLSNNTNHTLVNSSKDYSSPLPDLFDHVKKSVVQITDSADLKQQMVSVFQDWVLVLYMIAMVIS